MAVAASEERTSAHVVAAFDAWVVAQPNAPALVCRGSGSAPHETLSYEALDQRARVLASLLRTKMKVVRGTPVAILARREPQAIVAMMAVLRAGGTYVPLDPVHPSERLASMIAAAKVRAVLAMPDLLHRVPASFNGPLLGLSDNVLSADVSAAPTMDVDGDLGREDTASIFFTSGSTGRAKGVAVAHRGVLRLARSLRQAGFAPGKVILATSSLGFDPSTLEIWGALLNGACLVLHDEQLPTARGVGRAISERGVTTAQLITAAFHLVVDEDASVLRGLENVIVGGEAMLTSHAKRALAAAPSMRLFNAYGPTESTVVATWFALSSTTNAASEHAVVPIGSPIDETSIEILDEEGRPVPEGSEGEIYIGGAGLAHGYIGDARTTAERFVPNPNPSGDDGTRLYRTGDRGRRIGDVLHFVGRIDHQVKLRGFRIELQEIEAVLRRIEGVRDAAVVLHGEERILVAHVELSTTTTTTTTTFEGTPRRLRKELERVLPGPMIPAAFVVTTNKIPRNAHGKVDRSLLPPPQKDAFASAPFVAPRAGLESQFAALWGEVLGVESVGATDDFVSLGGGSLLAVKLAARVRAELNLSISPAEILEARTIQAMVAKAAVRANTTATTASPVAPKIARSSAKRRSLSSGERRMWLINEAAPTSLAYNTHTSFWLGGDRVDPKLLGQAIADVVAKHAILRTTYSMTNDVLVAAPNDRFVPELRVSEVADEAAALAEASKIASPFDLKRGPLLRAYLFVCGQGRSLLVLAIHHIVFDAFSQTILTSAIGESYSALLAGVTPPPAPELQYADYVSWQRQHASDIVETNLGFWAKRLEGAPPALLVPTDRPRPAMQSFDGGIVPVRLDNELVARVDQFAEERGLTRFMVVLAAWGLLLGRHARQRDVVIGCPFAGRSASPAADTMIGFFVQTLPLRLEWDRTTSFEELLLLARDRTFEGLRHEELPLDLLLDLLRAKRDPSRNPIFQAMLVFQPPPPPAMRLGGTTRVETFEEPPLGAQVDMMLSLTPESREEGGLSGHISYASELFERASVERWAERLTVLLDSLLANPGVPVEAVSMLTADDRSAIAQLAPPGATATQTQTQKTTKTFHERFFEQAARTPDAIAVRSCARGGTKTLSYAALAQRSDQLAHELAERGTRPEDLVGLFIERSPALVVSVLAIAKTGAAIVPMDPTYPEERIKLIIDHGRLERVVTQRSLADRLSVRDPILINDDHDAPLALECREFVRPSSAEQLLYVIFTSGSTGVPKGVGVPHRVLTNLHDWHVASGRLTPSKRTLQFTSLSFDVAFQEIVSTLLSGGTLEIIDDETRRDATQLFAFLEANKVERLHLPFVALESLAHGSDGRGFSSVTEVITAGEALRITPALETLFTKSPRTSLENQYGPTETHVATTHLLTGPPSSWPRLPPIGVPVANMKAHVLDEELRPVPVGVVGELFLSGAGVARGYVHRPTLTAQRFLPAADGDRMYRTGDLVRQTSDGVLEYVGREDDQVKLSGVRVELGEIESALSRLPHVNASAVAIHVTKTGAKLLVAYVVSDEDPPPQKGALIDALQTRLPHYMIPAAFVFLPKLPVTPSGKINRAALPPPDLEAFAASTYVAPRTDVERTLCELFAEILGVPRVGIHDDFFALGGSSLMGVRLIAAIRSRFHVALALRVLHEHPKVERLATKIDLGGTHREVEL